MLPLIVMALWIAVVVAMCVSAWLSRESAIRAAAVTCFMGWMLTLAVDHFWPHWHGLHPGVWLIDGLAAVALTWIAAVARTWWAICASSAQFAAVGLHFAYFLAPRYLSTAYYTGLSLLGFLLAFSILAGGDHAYEDQSA